MPADSILITGYEVRCDESQVTGDCQMKEKLTVLECNERLEQILINKNNEVFYNNILILLFYYVFTFYL